MNVFKAIQTDNSMLEGMYKKAMSELNEFFDKKWYRNTPKLFVVDDRKTIDLLRGEKTSDWIVGWNWGTRAIFILNPDNFKSESAHDYNEEAIYKLIKHELTHSFYLLIVGHTKPRWLTEGLCLYVADQLGNYKKPKTFTGFLDNKNIYQESGYVVKLLIDNYGKEKMVNFLKSLSNNTQAFNDSFRDEFEIELSYNSVNELSQGAH